MFRILFVYIYLFLTFSFTHVPFTLTLHRVRNKDASEQFVEEANEEADEMLLPQYIEDMMNTNNDFPPRAHCLARSENIKF